MPSPQSPPAMSRIITHGMVLAAGFGKRMAPITLTTPKPLVSVAGRSMLDRALDHLWTVEPQRVVVNTHWLAEQIEEHLANDPRVIISHEKTILETGGGIKKALPLLGADPFYVVNGDIIWTDGPIGSALNRLAETWDDATMDGLLLLHPTDHAVGYDGAGDFAPTDGGNWRWRKEGERAPYVFTGVQILHPRLFTNSPDGAFFLTDLYRHAHSQNRLNFMIHDGNWYHIGTPQSVPLVEKFLL